MIAYKLVRIRKDGTLGSLFINKKAVLPLDKWLIAEDYPTKGFAHRVGWHCTLLPVAPHLSTKDRIWVEVEIESCSFYERPESQGGTWVLAKEMKINKLIIDEKSAESM